MSMRYRANHNVVFRCVYHIIWCTKYRRPALTGEIETRLGEIVTAVAHEREAIVEAWEVMPDHVHLVVDIDPQYGVHRLVKQMKGRSSRLLRAEFPTLKSRLPTLWTNSYCCLTVGGAPLSILRDYVESQKRV